MNFLDEFENYSKSSEVLSLQQESKVIDDLSMNQKQITM